MDKTLTLFFEEEYLLAAIKPFDGKFTVFQQNNDIKFPFYFFVDNINNKIDYSFIYKSDFQDSKPNYYGNFLNMIIDKTQKYKWYEYETEIIDLLINIINNVRNFYFENLKKIGGDETIDESVAIPLNLVFSENVKLESREALRNYLAKQNFKINLVTKNLSELIVLHHINKNNFQIQQKDYAVVEALGENLNMSIVRVKNNVAEKTHFKVFPEYGTDPRVHVIAKKIVDDVNRQEGLLSKTEDLKKEYKRHQTKAVKIIEALKSFKKPFLTLSTTFMVEPSRKLVTNLSIEEIDKLSFLHARQFSSFLTDHFLNTVGIKILELDKIFLVGNTFNNELVNKEFARFGNERIIYLSDDISIVLQEAYSKPITNEPIVDNDATMFMVDENAIIPESYQLFEKLLVADLKIGQEIKLTNSDPVKGIEIQIMQYLGKNKFVITESNRSLRSGDIAEPIIMTWTKSIQLDFDIHRNHKFFGRFRTRPVVKIEVK